MKTVGVIAEYNPFHQGHKYLIEEAKKITGANRVVVVMSENAVQRGDFALVDKHARARAAVANGADLVLGLSFCYSAQSAEYFAKGGIAVLNSLGIVDYLCYGSEHDDMKSQIGIAEMLEDESEQIMDLVHKYLKEGINFPAAREKAVRTIANEPYNYEIMGTPNDILAIEYIRALRKQGSEIEPISIKRRGADHNDMDYEKRFPSASAIRRMLLENSSLYAHSNEELNYTIQDMRLEIEKLKEVELKMLKSLVPLELAKYIIDKKHMDSLNTIENYLNEIKTLIITRGAALENIFEVSEGLENLIQKHILESNSVQELALLVKSKRFTYTRIRRILMNILIGLAKEDMDLVKNTETVPYSRILAFNDQGRAMLREIREKETSILINKPSDFKPYTKLHKIQKKYDDVVDELYYMKYHFYQKNKRVYSGMSTSPLYIKEINGE